LLVVSVLNIFLPHVFNLFIVPMFTKERKKLIQKDIEYSELMDECPNLKELMCSQKKLNYLHVGPVFDMAINYAFSVNTVMFTMTYCSGMPIMLFIAFL